MQSFVRWKKWWSRGHHDVCVEYVHNAVDPKAKRCDGKWAMHSLQRPTSSDLISTCTFHLQKAPKPPQILSPAGGQAFKTWASVGHFRLQLWHRRSPVSILRKPEFPGDLNKSHQHCCDLLCILDIQQTLGSRSQKKSRSAMEIPWPPTWKADILSGMISFAVKSDNKIICGASDNRDKKILDLGISC